MISEFHSRTARDKLKLGELDSLEVTFCNRLEQEVLARKDRKADCEHLHNSHPETSFNMARMRKEDLEDVELFKHLKDGGTKI